MMRLVRRVGVWVRAGRRRVRGWAPSEESCSDGGETRVYVAVVVL